jgi:RNA polymerase sigma-70 factor (ECF subfamily)
MQSFERLFFMMNTRLIKFCVFYIGQKEAAEEIVADVFLKCWLNRANLADMSNPETYLFVAIKNQSINYSKKFSNIHLVQIEETNEVEFINTLDPEKELERKELNHLLDKAIDTLPRQACIVFKLIKEDGLKYKEVAEILNISPRTVQTQLFRAIKKLNVVLSAQRVYSRNSFKGALPKSVPGLTVLLAILKIFFLGL